MGGLAISSNNNTKRTKLKNSKLSSLKLITQNSQYNIELIFLQELHSTPGLVLHDFYPLGKQFSHRRHSASPQQADGVISFVKKGIICQDSQEIVAGRLTYLRLKHPDFPNFVNVYNLYNHHSGREEEALEVLDTLAVHLGNTSVPREGDIYVVGDFNMHLDPHSPPPPTMRAHMTPFVK